MKELIKALAKARANFGSISKDSEAVIVGKNGTTRRYKYTSLDDIIAATAPALADQGLHVYHSYAVQEGELHVTCRVTDGDHELTSTVVLPLSGVAEQLNQAQAVGSLLTYGRRYSISALLAVCTDADDDAQSVDKAPAPRAEARPIAPVDKSPSPDIQSSRQVMEVNQQKKAQIDWLNRKFDEFRLTQKDRDVILSQAAGKTMADIVAEIEAIACTHTRQNA